MHLSHIEIIAIGRAPDKVRNLIFKIPISSPNSMFDHMLESSHRLRTNIGLHRAPDKERKIFFNRLYLCYFFTKSYV